jgi:hypothetical protein
MIEENFREDLVVNSNRAKPFENSLKHLFNSYFTLGFSPEEFSARGDSTGFKPLLAQIGFLAITRLIDRSIRSH